MGFLALEAGWMVTELGRQPFTAWGVQRTSDAVTPVPGLALPFWIFTAIYLFLGAMVIILLRRQIAHAPGSVDSGARRTRTGGATGDRR
jgi:cytochrome d ubiquinol oxidase subunit I